MLQILLSNSGKWIDIGLSYKHTLFNFDKPINAFLLKDMILFDSKLIAIKLFKPLNRSSSIWFILLFCSHNSPRDVKPVNEVRWMDDIWLRYNSKRDINPDKSMMFHLKTNLTRRDVKPAYIRRFNFFLVLFSFFHIFISICFSLSLFHCVNLYHCLKNA